MSDRDRDELVDLVYDASSRNPFPEAEEIAEALIDAGYRKVTVTPEQIEAAATAIDNRLREYTGALSGNQALGAARAAARVFGLVPEDGEE